MTVFVIRDRYSYSRDEELLELSGQTQTHTHEFIFPVFAPRQSDESPILLAYRCQCGADRMRWA